MYDINVWTLLCIMLATIVITLLFCRRGQIEENFIYIFLSVSIFFYSGFGISYEEVPDSFIVQYLFFLVSLFIPIKLLCGKNVVFTFKVGNFNSNRSRREALSSKLDSALEVYPAVYKIATVIFLMSLFIYLLLPTFRISDLWHPPVFSAVAIHARRNAEKHILIRLADTLNIITLPFFFVYLQKLAEQKKRIQYFALVIAWAYLDYLKYCYLSRYQLMIYLLFLLFSTGILRYGTIKVDKRMITTMLVVAVAVVPFLVSFTFLRTGNSYSGGSYNDALRSLIDGETYYPIYYERILRDGQDLVTPTSFILWLICLPIPSVFWATKPIIDPSYEFTKMLIGYVSKTSATYYNSLPSILGEALMIFGRNAFFIEGLLLGIFIGIYFKFFFRSRKLSVLTLYMLLMLATIGRGGATSYMSVLINGSIILIVWVNIVEQLKRRRSI